MHSVILIFLILSYFKPACCYFDISEAQFPNFSGFVGQKSIFRHYFIQNVKNGIQIQAYHSNNETVAHFGQFILVKGKSNLRKFQAQFQEKLRKLRLK